MPQWERYCGSSPQSICMYIAWCYFDLFVPQGAKYHKGYMNSLRAAIASLPPMWCLVKRDTMWHNCITSLHKWQSVMWWNDLPCYVDITGVMWERDRTAALNGMSDLALRHLDKGWELDSSSRIKWLFITICSLCHGAPVLGMPLYLHPWHSNFWPDWWFLRQPPANILSTG